MPAYNAAKTLEKTYDDIPPGVVAKVILVDDVSRDEPVEVTPRLGRKVVISVQNKGYGGDQKTCFMGRQLNRNVGCQNLLRPV